MIDICLLGTGGMMPLPYRWLTSLMLRYNGSNILIDCGEGTQITIKKKGWSFKAIDVICFTHYHGDHISGLPGLLLTIGNSSRTEPITLIGPRGLEKVVNGLRVIAPDLPYELKFIELSEEVESMTHVGLKIEAFRAKHNVPCYGYNVVLERSGKFEPEKAKSLEIPIKYWSALQKGSIVENQDRTYTPEMVLGPSRKGLKISYCTDSRPTALIEEAVYEADLFICEGMYGDEEELPKAKENRHMMMAEAATIANKAQVKELWLTHFSPSVAYPNEYEEKVKGIFSNARIGKDRMTLILNFEE